MQPQDWTLDKLIDALAKEDPGALLAFASPDGPAGPGYHVTELKRADIASIDCAGRVDEWTETQVQIMDGQLGQPMRVGKFIGIAKTSTGALSGLGKAPLSFEFSPKNKGLGRFLVEGIQSRDGIVSVGLTDGRAQCKPMNTAQGACCEPSGRTNQDAVTPVSRSSGACCS